MFDSVILKELVDAHREGLAKLVRLEKLLNRRFLGLEPAIKALVLAVASGESLLFVGPPGTAKSRLIHSLCQLTGVYDATTDERQEGYFEYLLTPFTEPSELFGFYDLSRLHGDNPELVRLEEGMLQHAEVVFLDEIFNGSSAILNSLLAIMNERRFHDRGRRKRVCLKNLFAATNRIPTSQELLAVYDRFVLRCYVDYVANEPDSLRDLVFKGWQETYAEQPLQGDLSDLFRSMEDLRESIREATRRERLHPLPGHPVYENLSYLVELCRERGFGSFSNRRLIKLGYVMLIHRLYRAVSETQTVNLEIGLPELSLFWDYFLDAPQELSDEDHRDLRELPAKME